MAEKVKAEVMCGNRLASCVCARTTHTEVTPHECECLCQWYGDGQGDRAAIVRMPQVGGLTPLDAFLVDVLTDLLRVDVIVRPDEPEVHAVPRALP